MPILSELIEVHLNLMESGELLSLLEEFRGSQASLNQSLIWVVAVTPHNNPGYLTTHLVFILHVLWGVLQARSPGLAARLRTLLGASVHPSTSAVVY